MTGDILNDRPSRPGSGQGFAVSLDPAVAEPKALLHVSGELDLATAPALLACVRDLADSGCTQIDLDLTDVGFCDGAGLRALVSGREWLRDLGGTLVVHEPCWSLIRLMDVFDLTDTLDRRPSPTPEASPDGTPS